MEGQAALRVRGDERAGKEGGLASGLEGRKGRAGERKGERPEGKGHSHSAAFSSARDAVAVGSSVVCRARSLTYLRHRTSLVGRRAFSSAARRAALSSGSRNFVTARRLGTLYSNFFVAVRPTARRPFSLGVFARRRRHGNTTTRRGPGHGRMIVT